MTRWMTCREFIDFLWRYLEGETSAVERAEFELHLAGCPMCVNYLKTYRETIRMTRAAFETPDEPVPEDVPEELVEAILAAKRKGEEAS